MPTKNPFSLFGQVLCISLRRSIDRRAHVEREFRRVGICNYRYIDAFDKADEEVEQLFSSDMVMKYPPCFRCGRDECNCDNKSLFHAQIGNWLSHMSAWSQATQQKFNPTLICEDDVKFTDHYRAVLATLKTSTEINTALAKAEPLLVRLGWAFSDDHRANSAPYLSNEIRMSNPCYAINAAMAELLLGSLEQIDTTSDIYLHRIIGPTVNHYTILPPAAYELSLSTGELLSEIRPKQKHVEHLEQALAKSKEGTPEHADLERRIAMERARIREFEAFNDCPLPDYRQKYPTV